jgi:hypothetical protein
MWRCLIHLSHIAGFASIRGSRSSSREGKSPTRCSQATQVTHPDTVEAEALLSGRASPSMPALVSASPRTTPLSIVVPRDAQESSTQISITPASTAVASGRLASGLLTSGPVLQKEVRVVTAAWSRTAVRLEAARHAAAVEVLRSEIAAERDRFTKLRADQDRAEARLHDLERLIADTSAQSARFANSAVCRQLAAS